MGATFKSTTRGLSHQPTWRPFYHLHFLPRIRVSWTHQMTLKLLTLYNAFRPLRLDMSIVFSNGKTYRENISGHVIIPAARVRHLGETKMLHVATSTSTWMKPNCLNVSSGTFSYSNNLHNSDQFLTSNVSFASEKNAIRHRTYQGRSFPCSNWWVYLTPPQTNCQQRFYDFSSSVYTRIDYRNKHQKLCSSKL